MSQTWTTIATGGVTLAVCEPLREAGFARHGFALRHSDLNLSFRTEPDPARVRLNRARACAALAGSLADLTVGEQVHGAGIARVTAADRGRGGAWPQTAIPGVDGLLTSEPGTLLAVTVADCPPILLADPIAGTVAAVHSGWRGTAGRIAPKAVERMCSEMSARPERMVAAIGPAICGGCYETGPDVAARIREASGSSDVVGTNGRGRETVDLRAAIVAQLTGAGLLPANIYVAPWCTRCHNDLFFSHRGQGPTAGRFAGLIAIG